jgi:hypothetical protein
MGADLHFGQNLNVYAQTIRLKGVNNFLLEKESWLFYAHSCLVAYEEAPPRNPPLPRGDEVLPSPLVQGGNTSGVFLGPVRERGESLRGDHEAKWGSGHPIHP